MVRDRHDPPASGTRTATRLNFNSLRARIVGFLVVPFVLLLPLTALLHYVIALLPMREALDASLDRVALVVASHVEMRDGRPMLVLPDELESMMRAGFPDPVLIALVGADGRLVAGDHHLAGAGPLAAIGSSEHFDTSRDVSLRVAARGVACGDEICQVRIAEPSQRREQLELDVLLGSVASMLLLLVLIGALMWFGTRWSLAPVDSLRIQMEARSIDELQPVVATDVPQEVQPLVDAVNHLLRRLQDAAARHNEFIANAAHQLRTPLASLLARIELVKTSGANPQELEAAVAQLHGAVNRMARVTEQLLALARSDAGVVDPVGLEAVDLRDVATAAAREWVPRAAARAVDLGFDLHAASVHGSAQLLREMVNNLVDNALLHGGASVTVRTGTDGTRAWVEVEDDGPGIPPADRPRMFERFVRGSTTRSTGSGLGLAIVRRIAELHGAQARLLDASGPRGLRVRVDMPAFVRDAGARAVTAVAAVQQKSA